MAQKLYEESNIQAIADAIRGKNGLTNTYKTSEMAAAITAIESAADPTIKALDITANGIYTAPEGIDGYSPITVNVPQDGSPPEEAFTITGDCYHRFAYGGWDWFIKNYGSRVTTNGISDCGYMFRYSKVTNIPFELNFNSSSSYISAICMFEGCSNLQEIPKFNNMKIGPSNLMFAGCEMLNKLPDDLAQWFDWGYHDNLTSAYSGDRHNMFSRCFSLRNIPISFLEHVNKSVSNSYSYFYNGFNTCVSLDELLNLPIPYTATWTSNAFNTSFDMCARLKNLTFKTPDGQPYIKQWKSQVIDLSVGVGYLYSNRYKPYILNYNSGITADKEVTDDATYQALKDDPDWFTMDIAYSRYNHDSAVATINSLPDTSAYLASAGGTNTIKFNGAAGSATDGGAINTLTEEEIAVATAKGWTVTLN